MLHTFLIEVSSNLSLQKSPTVKILGIYFLVTIIPRKYMPKISVIGLFCCDKFEETPIKKVCNMSKLSESYFKKVIKISVTFCATFLDSDKRSKKKSIIKHPCSA